MQKALSEAGLILSRICFFAAACAVKFIPEADLPPWVWAVAVTAALLKTAGAFAGRAKGKSIAFEHSAANKALGLFIFLLLPFFERAYFAVPQARPAALPLRLRQVNL